jgi:hypothetical protein
MFPYAGYLTFKVDPLFSQDIRRVLENLLNEFKESSSDVEGEKLLVEFISEGSLHLIKDEPSFKICITEANQGLFGFGQNLEASKVDAILDESIDRDQLIRLLEPGLRTLIRKKEEELFAIGAKNIRRFEAKTKLIKSPEELKSFTSEILLNYTQQLVELERDLIHADDISKMEKVLKAFAKNHLEKSRFIFYPSSGLSKAAASKSILALPRYHGEFICVDLAWNDEDPLRLIKKYLFFSTLVGFFNSQQEVQDPFFDEKLWEGVLDGIPFPIALLSEMGEVYQHNTLFARLSYSPRDCLRLKLREKIMINDIPYNVFRKDISHLGEQKILFVFFTESFFLKGEGNLTPTGQELGIISSSIAHELNNPIAGIQAALTFIMLDESLDDEAKGTLVEMKNGAQRCKQLVETFLGFSRANTGSIIQNTKVSSIEVCYQQAQNLLRFRTVESGIRLSLNYSKHTDFRASVNLSLMTMTFYLILGELMTLYSHQLLVARSNQIEKVIKGEIIESSQEIQIQLHELNISTLTLSKLIQNLLNIENFVLQISDYSLRFIYNPRN